MTRTGFLTLFTFTLVSVAACGDRSLVDPAAERVFYGASLWDGSGAPTVENAVVQVGGGRILSVMAAPEGADVGADVAASPAEGVDLTGQYLIPGLINVHGHAGGTWTEALEASYGDYVEAELRRYARFGVTTVNSLGGDGDPSFQIRDESWNETAPGRARLLVAGAVVVGESTEEARVMVDENAERGADWIKIRVDDNLGATSKMTPEVFSSVI
ncbi:MAG: hypothetical protein OEO23_10370, partial [Gemmatimonadota bacterium]|nr:hypothetical protein [Gemmatimonadota bacterium]